MTMNELLEELREDQAKLADDIRNTEILAIAELNEEAKVTGLTNRFGAVRIE